MFTQKRFDRTIRFGLMVSASFALATNPAFAQETPEPTAPEAEAQTPPTALPTAQPVADEKDIIVTGSRIRHTTEFNSPDPIAIIDPAMSRKEGKFDTATMLQSSPIAAGSTQITSAISSNFVTNGGPGAQTIDLRGLGANRTLVLLNGRRAGPAGTRGGVSSFDLNVLPQSIVSSVQILKTGASSVYGSDAVAGVVNLITKTDTHGLQFDGNVSVPAQGGGEQYRLSAIWGKDFGNGHVTFAADYFKQNELARGDRKYLGCPEAYTFRKNGDRADLIDPRNGKYKCEDLRWGHVWTYDLEYLYDYGAGNLSVPNGTYAGPVSLIQYQYPGENLGIPPISSPPGALSQFNAPPGWFPTGYDTPSLAVQNSYHPFVLEQSLIPKTERYTAFAEGAIDVTDNVELFGEFLFNRRKTYQNGWRQFWNFGGTEDFYNNFWAPGWQGFNFLSPTGITNLSDSSQKVDYTRGVAGARGTFGNGFLNGLNWDVHAQYSRSDGKYRNQQILQDVYESGFFQTASCVGTTLPVSGKQCIDLPWNDPFFLRGELTPQQANFLTSWEEGKTVYTQLNSEATVNGDLFELPAGPIGFALGITARRDRINDTPGEITRAGNAWGASESGITAGYSITKEAFGELSVPILADRPFFKDLSLSGAARITSVKAVRKSDGFSAKDSGNWTYKVGGNWGVNNWIRFRGTYGTSFRAPALFEQFLADETSSPSQQNIDPCILWGPNLAAGRISQRIADNCAADGIPPNHTGGGVSATSIASGGIGILKSETSKAKTASVILTPRFDFLPNTRFSIAVDYFDIRVKGEITQLGAGNIIFGCYDSDSFPTDPLCSLFTRGQFGAPNNIATVNDKFVNIASQRNSGIDVTTSIRQDLGRVGTLSFLANMTWQTKDTFALFEDTQTSDNGESGSPKWVGDFNLTYQSRNKGWTIFYGMDVIGKTSDEQDYIDANGSLCRTSALRGEYCVALKAPMTFYHNASITKSINDRFDFTLGVSNLFNTKPPRVSVLNRGEIGMIGPVVAASQYDFLGRRIFVNVSRRF